MNVTFTPTAIGAANGSILIKFRDSGGSCNTCTNTIAVSGTGGASGSIFPKYQVLSIIYAPPGAQSSVDYGSSTMLGTSNSWSNSFSNQTVLTISFGGTAQLPASGGGSVSQTWTETHESSGSLTVSKTTANEISVPGPGNSNSGIVHDADLILVWINPESDFTATSSNGALWHASYDQRDPANEPHVIPLYVSWLKNPSTMPTSVQASLQRTWAGTGQGLTTTDYANILARDPFANGGTTIDPRRFDLQGGETFSYLPPPCGFQPITQTFSEGYNTTTSYGTTATDSYAVGYTKTAQAGMPAWFTVNFTATNTLTWTNQWGHQNTNGSGNSATFHITGPSDCHYSGPTDVQVYQDNVYGTFMFAFF